MKFTSRNNWESLEWSADGRRLDIRKLHGAKVTVTWAVRASSDENGRNENGPPALRLEGHLEGRLRMGRTRKPYRKIHDQSNRGDSLSAPGSHPPPRLCRVIGFTSS